MGTRDILRMLIGFVLLAFVFNSLLAINIYQDGNIWLSVALAFACIPTTGLILVVLGWLLFRSIVISTHRRRYIPKILAASPKVVAEEHMEEPPQRVTNRLPNMKWGETYNTNGQRADNMGVRHE